MAAVTGRLDDLRHLLAERFPHLPSTIGGQFQTGQSLLDTVLGDGLPKGAITELSSAQCSAGTASLINALLRSAYRDRYFLALIDGRDSFDPQPLGNICLRNLLWVRCTQAIEAVKAADLLLRDGNFPLVILDLIQLNDNGFRFLIIEECDCLESQLRLMTNGGLQIKIWQINCREH